VKFQYDIYQVQWINSWWWWAEEVPEKCSVSCQNKFEKLVHLFGFMIMKFIKLVCLYFYLQDPPGSFLVPMPVPSACYLTVRTQWITLYSQRQGNRTHRSVGTYLQDHMASNLRFHGREKDTTQKNEKLQFVLTGMAQLEVAQSVKWKDAGWTTEVIMGWECS
jgi:hypothetical protein